MIVNMRKEELLLQYFMVAMMERVKVKLK